MAVKWTDMFGSEAPKRTFSKTDVEAILAAHEADQLRGLGSLAARDLLVNDLVAAHNIVVAQLTGITPKKPEAAFKDNTIQLVSKQAEAAAALTKKAMG